MSAQIPVVVRDQKIIARELTFRDVRNWVAESEAASYRDPIHAIAFQGLGLDDLARMCDWSVDALEQFTASELQPLVEAARSINAPFFRVRGLLMGKLDEMLLQVNLPDLSAMPSSCQSVDIPT